MSQYAGQQVLPSRFNDVVRQMPKPRHIPFIEMTAADLGIVDQNLDDKVGMEP